MQTRSKRAKKDNKDENPVETEASVVICGGRPSPAPVPGSNAISGMPKMPPITDIDPTSGVPYATLVDQMLKTDSPSNPTSGVPDPTTPTERSDILIPPFKMLMSLPGQGQSVMAVPHAQTITSNMKHGEHFITVPMSVVATLQKETTTEERVTIPVHLLQQEIQKRAQQTQQPDVQQAKMIATHPESECLSPVPLQLNKSITSIPGALMSLPSTKPSSPSVLTGIPRPIHQSQPVSTTSMGPGLAQEPQGIRSKLLSRLMVRGSSMTNQSSGVRMPVQSLTPGPTSTPRPRLDHIPMNPNPNLTLPYKHRQPVLTSDKIVMATASNSSLDFLTGPPKLITAISEMTIANKSTLAIPSTSTHLENSRGFEKHTKTHNAELELEEHMRTHNAELEEHLRTYNAEIQEQMRTYNIELEPIRAHNEALKKHIRTFGKELRRHTKTYKAELENHMGTHNRASKEQMKTHNADISEQMRTQNVESKEHIRTYNAESREHMTSCNAELEEYIRTHNTELRKYIATLNTNLETHMRTHTDNRAFQCIICCKGTSLKQKLQRHMIEYTGDKSYQCGVCGKGWNSSEIKEHVKTCNTELEEHMNPQTADKRYKCGVCGKGFRWRQNIYKHIKKCTADKRYQCGVCGKGFSRKQNVHRHIIKHTDDKHHQCDVCGKQLRNLSTLNVHMRIHAGDKPYECDMCGKRFIIAPNLKQHMKIHTGDKPYKCDVCGKGFIRIDHLKLHMRIHTDDKSFKCDVCGKRFRWRQNVYTHIKNALQINVINVVCVVKGLVGNRMYIDISLNTPMINIINVMYVVNS